MAGTAGRLLLISLLSSRLSGSGAGVGKRLKRMKGWMACKVLPGAGTGLGTGAGTGAGAKGMLQLVCFGRPKGLERGRPRRSEAPLVQQTPP